MDDEERLPAAMDAVKVEGATPDVLGVRVKRERRSVSSTPSESNSNSRASSTSPEDRKTGTGSISTPENGAPAKLSRKASQKILSRPAPLFDSLPDVTEESSKTFQVIGDCLYGSRNMGSTDHDVFDCDCSEDWHDGQNHACGEDSNCINRATKIECADGDCNCGPACQNQRFQRKQYANVSVIKTEKKGFGLRANADLEPNDFVFEYIGEVINEPTFHRRRIQYDEERIKHFYFMSLTKHEFIDATKKGNLGRFCNHSCNPNCYVDKWVVGEKLRMGIFALRKIKTGEELVFDYNVDRYGADPQPCYCGEPNCTGYLGGKTQTERATKLPLATIEALGIDDGDSWDTTVARRPRKKKPTEDDEEYVNSVQPRGLDEDGVTKVMATLRQCKEKWIAVKLLNRIQTANEDRIGNQVVRMHGYQILKTTLNTFIDDTNVVLQILDILYKLPRLTKNKISDANIEAAIEGLTSSDHENVASESKRLLEEWSKLETAYRIPRKKFDPSAPTINSFGERRSNLDREEGTPKPADPFAGVVVPKGPRGTVPQRSGSFLNGQQQRPRKQPPPAHTLPAGWFVAVNEATNRYYFYNKKGQTQWHKPSAPFEDAENKAPSKAKSDQKALQDIIDSLTKEPVPRASAPQTPRALSNTPAQEVRQEKWRSYPIEKQMKIYENTLVPHVRHVMNKYQQKLPKEELKKFAREVNKKLVASDYKNNRVEDPTAISNKQEKKVKIYVKEFFDKAVAKYQAYERKKKDRVAKAPKDGSTDAEPAAAAPSQETPVKDEDEAMSIASEGSAISDRKRKRDDTDVNSPSITPSETPSVKRLKEEEIEVPTPPPPPPPEEDIPMAESIEPLTEEERSMREQEEALMRENEESQRLEEEANRVKQEQEDALQRENEDAQREFDLAQHNGQSHDSNGSAVVAVLPVLNGNGDGKVNGVLHPADGANIRMDSTGPDEASDDTSSLKQARKEVLSH